MNSQHSCTLYIHTNTIAACLIAAVTKMVTAVVVMIMANKSQYLVCLHTKCLHVDQWFLTKLAVDMDIHGYIHVWISDFSHPVDISMDIVLSHLLIKLNI